MPTHSSQATAEGMPKIELPEQRINRLAKELSAELNGFDDYSVVMVFPSKSREYPIHICLDREIADLMQRAIQYCKEGK